VKKNIYFKIKGGIQLVNELKYSSGLNGATFLIYELKQVIKLKLEGYSDKEIRHRAIEENIFQFNNKGRITRVMPSIMRRAKVLDSFLGEAFLNRNIETSNAINLYTIMKTDLIFSEFMIEVVGERFKEGNYFLNKKDMNIFFRDKAEQSEIVSGWSDINIEKLKRAMLTVLFEAGILIKRKQEEIKPLILDEDLKQHLKDIGDEQYIKALGDYII